MFQNLRIPVKIAIPATLLATVSILIAVFATISMQRMADIVTLGGTVANQEKFALEARSAFNSVAVSEKNVILTGNDLTAAQQHVTSYDKAFDDTLQALDALARITRNDEQQKLIESVRANVRERKKVSLRVFDLALAKRPDEAYAMSVKDAAPYRKVADEALTTLVKVFSADIAATDKRAGDDMARQESLLWIGSTAGLGVALALFAWIALAQIAWPVASVTKRIERLAAGDLNGDADRTDRQDEVGALTRSLEIFQENARTAHRVELEQREERALKEVRQQAIERLIADFDRSARAAFASLAQSATDMRSTAEGLSETATLTTSQAHAVAAASEQTSNNVQTVAAATEELSASIGAITDQVGRSASIAANAVAEAEQTNRQVQDLTEAASRIGEVVNLIRNIAGQTNLLALNATIEAARAGEHGKGFAVVAHEVKALANQTAQATDEIAAQVGAIQEATGRTRQSIDGIAGTIGDINQIANSIADSVKEQGSATQEIARTVMEAARGAGEVSSNIAGVSDAAAATGHSSGEVLSAAGDLGRQTEKLRGDVDRFLDQIRTA
jgi:methyl-accepting chemotaxis protein